MSWLSKLQPLNFLKDVFFGWIAGGNLSAQAAEIDVVKAVLSSLTSQEKAQATTDVEALRHIVDAYAVFTPNDTYIPIADTFISDLEAIIAGDLTPLTSQLDAPIGTITATVQTTAAVQAPPAASSTGTPAPPASTLTGDATIPDPAGVMAEVGPPGIVSNNF